eukprot:CAMPEP_0197465484 /NCGR_PEP_ID=MMETSP1175-20131217/64564_1 /TAXON_ID=1003142 /ORGANISM="Triceratium dubium, Strain CCMP147" /LENGTH=139 /DNA_ID=CAMNT_0043001501 /DNA_START=1694 /DNA_END=2114 /DNA_ORIENTATION=-
MPPTRSKAGGLERHHDFGSVVDGGGKDESGTVLHFHQIAACIFLVETMRSVQRRIRATDGTAAAYRRDEAIRAVGWTNGPKIGPQIVLGVPRHESGVWPTAAPTLTISFDHLPVDEKIATIYGWTRLVVAVSGVNCGGS